MISLLTLLPVALLAPAFCHSFDYYSSSLNQTHSLVANWTLSSASHYTSSIASLTSASSPRKDKSSKHGRTKHANSHQPTNGPVSRKINSTLPAHTASAHNASFCNSAAFDGQFPYQIPYGTAQSCDIFGPTCQTGSITVKPTCTDSLVTLPCSSYLAAQSSYLEENRNEGYVYPLDWTKKFGRHQKCWSYMHSLEKMHGTGTWTFSQCPASERITAPPSTSQLPAQVPAGVSRWNEEYQWCCGECVFDIPRVTVHYFWEDRLNDICRKRGKLHKSHHEVGGNSTAISNLPVTAMSITPAEIGHSTVVLKGHTLTSPSIYVEVGGTVTVDDFCGPLGSTLTRPFISLPSGGIFTVLPSNLQHGSTFELRTAALRDETSYGWEAWAFNKGFPKTPLKLEDLACPTYGVGVKSYHGGNVVITVGSPYLPLLVPMHELTTLDPVWKTACKGKFMMKSKGVLDPPKVLEIKSELVQDTPPAEPTEMSEPRPQKSSPLPGQSLQAVQPQQTAGVGQASVKNPVGLHNPTSFKPNEEDPNAPDPTKSDSKVVPNQLDQSGQQASPARQASPVQSDRQAPDQGRTTPNPSPGKANDNSVGSAGDPALDENYAKSQGPGQETGSGNDDLDVDSPDQPSGSSQVKPTSGSTPEKDTDESKTNIGSNAENDGQPKTVQNLPNDDAKEAPLPQFAVAGQDFKVNPAGFSVVGTQILPGAPAVTLSGTPISLGSSGHFMIGSQTFILPSPTRKVAAPDSTSRPGQASEDGQGNGRDSAPNEGGHTGIADEAPASDVALEIAGQTITPDPSGFMIAGKTISPGASAVMISGTPVSLDDHRHLAVGSVTVSLPTPTNRLPNNQVTIGGQTLTADPTGFVLGGSTVTPGGKSVVVSGTTVSLGANGVLEIGTMTTTLASKTATAVKSKTIGTNSSATDPVAFTGATSKTLPVTFVPFVLAALYMLIALI